jgi:subtilisin family serine protease
MDCYTATRAETEVYIRVAMAERPCRIRPLSFPLLLILALSTGSGCPNGTRTTPDVSERGAFPLRRGRASGSRFEGDFETRLKNAESGRRFVALIDLTDQLDLRAFVRKPPGEVSSKSRMRVAVIDALERVASGQQERLRGTLAPMLAAGELTYEHPVAVVNRVIVEGTAAAILAIGASPEVAWVRPDWTSERTAARSEDVPIDPVAALGTSFRSWAIEAMKADRLWRDGLDGTGVVVASIDTGAFEAHEQLRDRRVPGERGWLDPVEGSTVATDHHGHGTGVLSQAIGANPEGRIVGVAPGARWASALGNWKNFYSRSRMTLAADWILRVARPDVVVNAWSHDEGECSDFDLPFIDAWKASGIFVVFPAGNGGPGRATGESPAQLRGIFPSGGAVFSVAALAQGGEAHTLSSRGPSRCGNPDFPTLAAPGGGLPIAWPGGPKTYVRGSGTSLSAGLVGGAAALLLQAAPETDPETLERVLVESTRDVPPRGRDDATGAGAIDLEAALARLRAGTP